VGAGEIKTKANSALSWVLDLAKLGNIKSRQSDMGHGKMQTNIIIEIWDERVLVWTCSNICCLLDIFSQALCHTSYDITWLLGRQLQ
jgi:hypothetical protein